MAQPQSPRTKKPLDVLQSMINGILIETGRALRATDREGTRSMGPANIRLRSTIPSAIENFHLALDELECDIVRAKSVLGRDLEQLRAQRHAAENPSTQISEDTMKVDSSDAAESFQAPTAVMAPSQPTSEPQIKEEFAPTKSPQKTEQPSNQPTPNDPPKESIVRVSEDKKTPHVPSPQPSNETSSKANAIGLGIDTAGAANSEIPAPSTGENQNSAIDSLFGDFTESNDNNNDNNANADLHFDDMDFSLHDSNANTQNPDQSQSQNHEFDLSTFGDPANGNDGNLDFNMTDLQPSNDANSGDNNANNDAADKHDDLTDLFDGMDDNTGGDVFDDMFFGTGDDGGMSGGGMGEIEHGEFDNAFFGLED